MITQKPNARMVNPVLATSHANEVGTTPVLNHFDALIYV
jgi:hypothetical protein